MRNTSMTIKTRKSRGERGATTVEYAVTVVCLVIATLSAMLLLADPTRGINDSTLPSVYNSVSSKAATFGRVDD